MFIAGFIINFAAEMQGCGRVGPPPEAIFNYQINKFKTREL